MASAIDPPGGKVVFSGTFLEDGVKLMELPREIMDALKVGDRLSIRGSRDDEAVLCTADKSFVVRKIESSNTSLILAPRAAGSASGGAGGGATALSVAATATCTYELIPTLPRLDRLGELLGKEPYRGVSSGEAGGGGGGGEAKGEGGADGGAGAGAGAGAGGSRKRSEPSSGRGKSPKRQRSEGTGYTTEELLGEVQASEAELQEGLRELGALQIDGRWRVVDAAYLAEIFDLILSLCIEHDWPLGAVSSKECCAALSDENYCPVAIQHALRVHARSEDSGEGKEGGSGGGTEAGAVAGAEAEGKTCWELDLTKVAMFKAKRLLQERRAQKGIGPNAAWPVDDFMDAWAGSLPEGVPVAMEALRGIALCSNNDDSGDSAVSSVKENVVVEHYPASELPRDAKGRFQALFDKRAKWDLVDLDPYVDGLVNASTTKAKILLKYTRSSLVKGGGGARQYSKR